MAYWYPVVPKSVYIGPTNSRRGRTGVAIWSYELLSFILCQMSDVRVVVVILLLMKKRLHVEEIISKLSTHV
jgi:hypothetical protein